MWRICRVTAKVFACVNLYTLVWQNHAPWRAQGTGVGRDIRQSPSRVRSVFLLIYAEAILQTHHDYPRAVIGQSPWLSSWLVKVIDPLFTGRIFKISLCAKSLATHQTAWRCTARLVTHNFSACCRSEFACFQNHFPGIKHEKLCNFELLPFEIGRTYFTSFLIYCRKTTLSVSINNQSQINVRKKSMQLKPHTTLFYGENENKLIGI